MVRAFTESDSFDDYFDRVKERIRESDDIEVQHARIRRITASAEHHFQRLASSELRYQRAKSLGDATSATWELDTMTALLYEALDTVYIVFQAMDPNALRIEATLDGRGIAGEDAPFLREILDSLERICTRLQDIEARLNIPLDFSRPVDEREGITYEKHRHWQDFVPNSVAESFNSYFAQARHGIHTLLHSTPKFWTKQTVREELLRTQRVHLVAMLDRLDNGPQKRA